MPLLTYETDGCAVAPAVLRQVDVHIQQVLEHFARTRESSTDLSGRARELFKSALNSFH